MSGQQSGQGRKAEFINPPNVLKKKVGDGGIAPHLLSKGQKFINSNDIDFEPYAEKHLNDIRQAMQTAQSTEDEAIKKQALANITRDIMQLKANGGMFGYQMISMIADVALNFIEAEEVMNDDLCSIIEAHNNSLFLIIKNRLKGDGGREGAALAKELYDATRRYQKKYSG